MKDCCIKTLMKFVVTMALAMFAVSAHAQGYGALSAARLPLIPYPAEITVGGNDYVVGASTTICITNKGEDDAFAVSTMTDDYIAHKWDVRRGAKAAKRGITVARRGSNQWADKAIDDAGLKLEKGNAEAYVLLCDGEKVVVEADSAAGIFYGIQTLRQLVYRAPDGKLKIRAAKIADAPSLKYRWIMDDWNRGPIPNMEYVKKQIRILSEYKINGYCIYAENIFQSKKYPQINMRGAVITPQEVRELVEYGKKYHVEIVPQQEALGHMHYTLREAGFDDIAERPNGQVVSPAVERTYTFLNDYFSEIEENFESDFIHVGCDEAFELGLGKSKKMVEELGLDGAFFKHLQRVCSLPAISNKRVMFWADVAVNKKDIDLSILPKNAVAVAWEYLARDNYEYYLPQIARNKVPFFVAPGAMWSTRLFPDFDMHFNNIRGFVRDGKKYGAIGMLCCDWDDMGEDIFDVGWYSVVFAADCAWQRERETSIEDYKRAFDWAFYRNISTHDFAQAIDSISDAQHPLGAFVMADWFRSIPFEAEGAGYQNTIQKTGKMQPMRQQIAAGYARLSQSRPKAMLHQNTIDAVMFSARRLEFVYTKAALAAWLSKRYDDFCNDDDKGRPINTATYDIFMPQCGIIGSLRDFTMELKDWHHELWMKENRPFHWDIVEARYNHMLQAWNDEEALLHSSLGGPREKAGFLFERMK